MIEIIKQGQTKFTAYCSQCGCEFTYELEDLDAAECIKCPCCEHIIMHIKSRKNIHYPQDVGFMPLDNINNTQVSSVPKSCDSE